MPDTPAAAPAAPLAALLGAVPGRPRVVLYTSSTAPQVVARRLAHLGSFTASCGWLVVHEVYDLAPPEAPRRRRIGWCTVENLVVRGEANGVIAPAEQEIAWAHSDRIALRAWLLNTSVFTVYLHDEPSSEGRAQAWTGPRVRLG
ncbi:hypothetical protein [Streptomyces sp. NPDC055099]